jgi:hypothetical protein
LRQALRGLGDVAALRPETLLWVRLGASEHLLRGTIEFLGGRRVGDRLLIHDPVVRTQVAHAVSEQLMVEAELSGLASAPHEATLTRLHRALTDVDRLLLRLLGGSSFLSDGPGAEAMLSESLRELVSVGSTAGVAR